MQSYRSELLETFGKDDEVVLVGYNRNLRGTGYRNVGGDMVNQTTLEDGTIVINRADGLTIRGKVFSNDPFERYENNKIILSKSTVRRLLNGNINAKGILFHEWQHASDHFSGLTNMVETTIKHRNLALSILELRAYNFNPYHPGRVDYLLLFNQFMNAYGLPSIP